MNQNTVTEYQKLCSSVCSPQSSSEKLGPEQLIFDSLMDWNNLPTFYYILSNTSDEVTHFVTYEYLNKILLSERGFSNFPEKSSNFSWKDDVDNSSTFEGSGYNDLLQFLVGMLRNGAGMKSFIRNSLCNLISQLLRVAWNQFGALGSVLEKIFKAFRQKVREMN